MVVTEPLKALAVRCSAVGEVTAERVRGKLELELGDGMLMKDAKTTDATRSGRHGILKVRLN